MEVLQYLRRAASQSRQFDLIFLDPPYERRADAAAALILIASTEILAPGGVAILERSIKANPVPTADGLERFREVRHGDSILQLYRREAV